MHFAVMAIVLSAVFDYVLFRLHDCYVKYELNVYAASSDDMPRLYSKLHQNIRGMPSMNTEISRPITWPIRNRLKSSKEALAPAACLNPDSGNLIADDVNEEA